MKIPLAFVKPQPISELEEITTLQPGNFLFDDGDGNLKRMKTDNFYQILNNFARPISPADAGPFTANRWYKPTISSADPGTNYPNAQNLKVKSGFDSLFFFDGTTWTKTEVALPGSSASQIFNPIDNANPSTMKAAADRYDSTLAVLKTFITPPGDILKKEYNWMGSNQVIYGVSPQGGILKKDNTVFNYSETGAEFRTWINVPATEFDFIDLNFVRLGGSSNGNYVSLIGKKSNGAIDVLIAPNSDPATKNLENITLPISGYESISFTLINFTANNAGLNTDFKFIKKGGILEEDAVIKKINTIISNSSPNVINAANSGLISGSTVSDSVRILNTSILNNLIVTLISKGGGKLIIPAGDYCVGQIIIPDIKTWVNIQIEGEFIPAQRFGTIVVPNLYEPDITLSNGTVLISNAMSSGGVIDCSSGTSYQNFNMGMLTVRNLTIRTYENPQISGINAWFMFQLYVENVIVDTGVYNVNAIEPTFDRSAIITPGNSNCALTYIKNVSLQGYMHGIKIYEHTNGDSLQIQSCKNAVSFYFASHSSNLTRCCFQRNTIQVNIVEEHIFQIAQLNMEYVGNGQTTSENAWQATQWELHDPNNKGIANIYYANVKGNLGTVSTFRLSGGNNIIVKRFGSDMRVTTTVPSP